MAATEPGGKGPVKVGPSPFREMLYVSSGTNDARKVLFRLYDQAGRLLLEQHLSAGKNSIATHTLPPGLYYWSVLANQQRVSGGKCVKIAN